MDLKFIYIILSDVCLLFCCAYLPRNLYPPICLLKLTYQPLSPKELSPIFFNPFQSLPRHCYHIPLKSYMHTYFPLAYKPINIWQPFWSSWLTLSTLPWYYSWSPSPPSPPSTPYPFPLLSHHAWNKLIKGHQFREPWKHKWHKTQVLKYKICHQR